MAASWRLTIGVLAVASLVACQAAPTARRGAPARGVGIGAQPSPGGTLGMRVLPGDRPLLLGGEVRLISDHGGGIVSNNSGGIVSNNSGGLLPNLGGAWRGLAQADAVATTPKAEAYLADAVIELLDAAGHPLAGPDGKAIQATTNAQGRYQMQAYLPPGEGAVARVKLFNGGELRALVVGSEGGTQSRNLNTAASLGASYVLDELVKGEVKLLGKLPLAESEALDREAELARVRLGDRTPSYSAADTLALAKRLKGEDKLFGDRLERIAAILAAGQANRGAGLLATKVPLSAPVGVVAMADGGAMVFECFLGQPRRVSPEGIIEDLQYPKEGLRPLQLEMVQPTQKGGALLLEGYTGRILRVSADLQHVEAIGPGLPANPASPSWVDASAVAEGPQGEVLIATDNVQSNPLGDIIIVPAGGGSPTSIKLPASIAGIGSFTNNHLGAVAMDREGSVYVAAFSVGQAEVAMPSGTFRWMAKRLNTGQWVPLFGPEHSPKGSHYVLGSIYPDRPEGPVALLNKARAVLVPGPDGRWVRANALGAAPSESGLDMAQSSFQEPLAGAPMPNGGFLFVDRASGLLHEWTRQGKVHDLAGTRAMEAVGQAQVVGLNTPGQPVELPDGSLLVPEGANGLVKQLKQGRLSLFAGSGGASGPLPGPKEGVSFDLPTAMARDPQGGVLYLACADGLYRIAPDGQVSLVLRGGAGAVDGKKDADGRSPSEAGVGALSSVCVDLEGRPWVSSRSHNCVYMLGKDGLIHRMAGQSDDEKPRIDPLDPDGPATGTALISPLAIATGPDGRIYVADTLRFRVRAIDPKTGLMEAVVGATMIESASTSREELDVDGGPAKQARLLGPISLAFDAQGNLYIGEAGTGVVARGSGLVPDLGFAIPDIPPQIRKRTPDGRLFLVAGPFAKVLNAASGDEAMGMPTGLLVDAQGRLAISDSVRNQLKLLPSELLAVP